jgi:hypothetical protein
LSGDSDRLILKEASHSLETRAAIFRTIAHAAAGATVDENAAEHPFDFAQGKL